MNTGPLPASAAGGLPRWCAAFVFLLILASCGGSSAPATLTRVILVPETLSIKAGTAIGLIATAVYSDSSVQNVTEQASWVSSAEDVASVDANSGVVSGKAPGGAVIAATFQGLASSIQVTVTDGANETILFTFDKYSFGPTGNLVEGSDGNLYGVTHGGVVGGNGDMFMMTPAGALTNLSTFYAGSDGANPVGSLIQAKDGNFYGMTSWGGANGLGTIFRASSTGARTILYSFAGGADGSNPTDDLMQADDGDFYGMTPKGGASDHGTVFRLTPDGTQTVLYSFGGGADGSQPVGHLIQADDGDFYGMTPYGGASDHGTVFRLTPDGTQTVLYSFAGGADGGYPTGSLIQASDGDFYGITSTGGPANAGTVFKLTRTGTKTVLYAFKGGADGRLGSGSLIQARDGNFYGVTARGGQRDSGVAFRLTASGDEVVLHAFGTGGSPGPPVVADGTSPNGLIQAGNGSFYGMTSTGGSGRGPFGSDLNGGIVFRLD